jgi:hypothetical protein
MVLEANNPGMMNVAELFVNNLTGYPSAGVRRGKTITSPSGSPGWTMRKERSRLCADGTWRYPISDSVAALISEARSTPPPQRTMTQKTLAALPEPVYVPKEDLEEEIAPL